MTLIRQALRILSWQLGWAAVSSVSALLLIGARIAWSMLAGAGIGLLGIAIPMFMMVRNLRATRPATLFSVLRPWLIKTILMIGLLLIAMRSRMFVPLAMILGLTGSYIVYWLSLIVGGVKHANGVDGK